MHNKKFNCREAFTLIEVMVAVLIISVVILALLEMKGNSSFMFSKLINTVAVNQYASFFISNPEYGFEKDSVDMDELVKDFKVEDDLRRKLKEVKVELVYQELQRFGDMSQAEQAEAEGDTVIQDNENKPESQVVLEIGRTVLKINDKKLLDGSSSTALVRLRLQ